MTEKEVNDLFLLCRDFSALDEEHQQLALNVSKDLWSLEAHRRNRVIGTPVTTKAGKQAQRSVSH